MKKFMLFIMGLMLNMVPGLAEGEGFVEGAGHNFTPARDAEKYNKTSYGDTVKKLFDYVNNWLSERFVK